MKKRKGSYDADPTVSICFSDNSENILMSSAVVNGYAMICTTGEDAKKQSEVVENSSVNTSSMKPEDIVLNSINGSFEFEKISS